jgi:hypothetical protein
MPARNRWNQARDLLRLAAKEGLPGATPWQDADEILLELARELMLLSVIISCGSH